MADLITLQEYKLVKGLVKNDEDPKLQHFIGVASSLIQTYLGRDFTSTSQLHTEVIDRDYSSNTIFLDKYPISEIVSIQELNPTGYDSTVHWPLPASDYYVDYENGKLIKTNGYLWSYGPGAIIVQYRTGNGMNSVTATIPLEIKQAAIDLVTYYNKEEYVPSKQTRGATITNSVSGRNGGEQVNEFPPHIQRVLDLYK